MQKIFLDRIDNVVVKLTFDVMQSLNLNDAITKEYNQRQAEPDQKFLLLIKRQTQITK